MPIVSTASNLKVFGFTVVNIPKVLNREKKMDFILPLFLVCFTRATRPGRAGPGQGFEDSELTDRFFGRFGMYGPPSSECNLRSLF